MKSINTGHIVDIVHPVVPLIVVSKWVFFYCYFGDNVTTQFEHLHILIYQWNWITLPIEIQKLLPTVMLITGKPVYLKGVANIRCTKEVFKRVSFQFYFEL